MSNGDTINYAFGRALAKRRDELGITQAKLSSLTGLSRASIASIEKGRQNVLLYHIYELASALEFRHIGDLLPARPTINPATVEVRASDGSVSDSDTTRVLELVERLVPATKSQPVDE